MKLLGITLFALIFTQCASVKLSDDAPFTVQSATYTPNGDVKIYYNAVNKVMFDDIYFNGKQRKLTLNKDEKGTYITGSFQNSLVNLKDIQLHSDPAKEYGNTPPQKEKEIPFKLKENEAVISYKIDGKTNYYKVKNLRRK